MRSLPFEWDQEVATRFSAVKIAACQIEGVHVGSSGEDFDQLEEKVTAKAKSKYTLETIKDEPIMRHYRDFYWKEIRLDPTKTRPASEALLRRILAGQKLPRILDVVDAYNLASVETLISFAAYDASKLEPPIQVRLARKDEPFNGVGMKVPLLLQGQELVLVDGTGLVCVYPYRDSDRTKITEESHDILLLGSGVPGISEEILKEGMQVALTNIKRLCGGTIGQVTIIGPRLRNAP